MALQYLDVPTLRLWRVCCAVSPLCVELVFSGVYHSQCALLFVMWFSNAGARMGVLVGIDIRWRSPAAGRRRENCCKIVTCRELRDLTKLLNSVISTGPWERGIWTPPSDFAR